MYAVMDPQPLDFWTLARIKEQCDDAWQEYDDDREREYTAYFADSTHRHPLQAWSAKNIACALPPRWEELADRIPKGRHSQHLSSKSSQVLALALLGASASLEPTHAWLWDALGLADPPTRKQKAVGVFEYEVGKDVLNETTGQRTSIDYFVHHPASGTTICIEAKWCENGLGICGCAKKRGCDPTSGACYSVMRDKRPALWAATAERLGLPPRADREPCPLHPTYQAVRNVAAALKLRSKNGPGVFALLYDTRNPYFAGCGEWPGWPAVLTDALADTPDFLFRAVSWQDLMPTLVLDTATRNWASEKHGLS